jgi:NADH:ubiquinone oxidoreductase subunit 2 (subunit N)
MRQILDFLILLACLCAGVFLCILATTAIHKIFDVNVIINIESLYKVVIPIVAFMWALYYQDKERETEHGEKYPLVFCSVTTLVMLLASFQESILLFCFLIIILPILVTEYLFKHYKNGVIA